MARIAELIAESIGRTIKQRGVLMSILRSEHVAPLSAASGHYLQVLLETISLRRTDQGVALEIQFNDNSPAIWSRHGRSAIFDQYADHLAGAPKVQEEIDQIVLKEDARTHFRGADFPFRYASGGALPIVRHKGQSYYCLFQREIHPFGWNIANGGSDSVYELLDPTKTMEREFHEEVIIVDSKRRTRFLLDRLDSGPPPGLCTADALAFEKFPWLGDIASYESWDCALRWAQGPDTLVVRSGPHYRRECPGVFVNVTAADCAIEVDRLVYLDLDDDAIIIHGETIDRQLLDSPVGLFEVSRLNEEVTRKPWGSRALIPDILFHSGQKFAGDALEDRVENHFLPWVSQFNSDADLVGFRQAQKEGRWLDLCPVTEGLVRRIAPKSEPRAAHEPFNTFLSHPTHPDAPIVYKFLTDKVRAKVYSYQDTRETTDFVRDIDDALDQARNLVVFGTRISHFEREWVRYEYTRFLLDMMDGRRPDLQMFCIAPGLDPAEMPGGLRVKSKIIRHTSLDACLAEIERDLRTRLF